MAVCIVLLVLGAICLTLFLIEKVRKYSVKETLIKACTSFLFIALAAYSNYHNGGHPFGLFVICGLALGLMGDIWLDLKYVFPEQSRIFTYAGFISFAIGHIFYISGMMSCFDYNHQWYSFVGPILVGLIGGALVILLEKPLKMKYGEYKAICFIYGTILFTMTAMSLYLTSTQGFQKSAFNMLMAGGILFALSDLILSGTYFAENREKPIDIISNSVTYYAAQYLIAFSLFFI